jgi:hypothetical protein
MTLIKKVLTYVWYDNDHGALHGSQGTHDQFPGYASINQSINVFISVDLIQDMENVINGCSSEMCAWKFKIF